MQGFTGWLRELDELLRGNKTSPELLAEGTEQLALKPYVIMSLLLGILYGACMGLFAVLNRAEPCYLQLVSSALKVPALFLLTLVVTFPSLYVFSALLGAPLGPAPTMRIVVAAITVNLAVLASFGPITAFFTLTTTSYEFMKLLNVFFFTVAGVIGLGMLAKVLDRLEGSGVKQYPAIPDPATGAPPSGAPPIPMAVPVGPPRKGAAASNVFRVWLILYALVGAQMGWVLRPFIATPGMPFSWFRAREANIFMDVLHTLKDLLGG